MIQVQGGYFVSAAGVYLATRCPKVSLNIHVIRGEILSLSLSLSLSFVYASHAFSRCNERLPHSSKAKYFVAANVNNRVRGEESLMNINGP